MRNKYPYSETGPISFMGPLDDDDVSGRSFVTETRRIVLPYYRKMRMSNSRKLRKQNHGRYFSKSIT